MSDQVSDALDQVAANGPPTQADPVSAALDSVGTQGATSQLPAWEQTGLGRAAALSGRALAQGAAGLPLMAMDLGVASRNVFGDLANKALGRPATPDYELPSQMWDQALNTVLPQPETGLEKGGSFAESMLSGGALSPSEPVTAFQTDAEQAALAQRSQQLRPVQNGLRALELHGIEGDRPGYVIPPATADPGAVNQGLESVAGKIAMQQHASLANQGVTNALAKSALGVDQRLPLTAELPGQIRAAASQEYKALGNVDRIALGDNFKTQVRSILGEFNSTAEEVPSLAPKDLQPVAQELLGKDSLSGKAMLGAIRGLRDKASASFKAGEGGTGTAYRQMASALEGAVDEDLSARGPEYQGMLGNFRAARQKIAIAHTVEDAMNPATGNVVAGKLASALRRGEPLSGPLKTAAEFANAAPRAVQEPTSSMGVSHLNATWPALGALGGSLAHGFEGGMGGALLGVGLPVARAGMRKALLSGVRQEALANLDPAAQARLLSPRLVGALSGARQDWSDVVGDQ